MQMQTCKPKPNLFNKFTKDLCRVQFFGKFKISPHAGKTKSSANLSRMLIVPTIVLLSSRDRGSM